VGLRAPWPESRYSDALPWSRRAWPATDRRQDVVDIYTTLDGWSMKLQTGRKFEFRSWAAGK
jgi:hypothetical protein